jgi:hypothetical protein
LKGQCRRDIVKVQALEGQCSMDSVEGPMLKAGRST